MYEDVLCRNISINKNNIRFIELYKVKVNEGIMKVYFGENLNLEAVLNYKTFCLCLHSNSLPHSGTPSYPRGRVLFV